MNDAEPEPGESEPANEDFAEPALYFCVCCGRLLGEDPEDELDGEGPGRDICGNCNRGRNWDAIESMEDGR